MCRGHDGRGLEHRIPGGKTQRPRRRLRLNGLALTSPLLAWFSGHAGAEDELVESVDPETLTIVEILKLMLRRKVPSLGIRFPAGPDFYIMMGQRGRVSCGTDDVRGTKVGLVHL